MDLNTGRKTTQAESSESNETSAPAQKKSPGKFGGGRTVELHVKPLQLERLKVTLEGQTPLIVNNFSNRGAGLIEMRSKQLGEAQPKKREPKNPIKCFIDSLYWTKAPKVKGTLKDFIKSESTEPSRDGIVSAKGTFSIPFSMIKGAIETAALAVDGASKAAVQRSVRIVETWIEIKGSDPVMREDVVRLKDFNRTADLRYRGMFKQWSVSFTVEYLATAMKAADVINLLHHAGFTSGLGEWRPEKGGEFGRFTIKGT